MNQSNSEFMFFVFITLVAAASVAVLYKFIHLDDRHPKQKSTATVVFADPKRGTLESYVVQDTGTITEISEQALKWCESELKFNQIKHNSPDGACIKLEASGLPQE